MALPSLGVVEELAGEFDDESAANAAPLTNANTPPRVLATTGANNLRLALHMEPIPSLARMVPWMLRLSVARPAAEELPPK